MFFEVRSLESAFYEMLPRYPHPVSVRREHTFFYLEKNTFLFFPRCQTCPGRVVCIQVNDAAMHLSLFVAMASEMENIFVS